MMVVNNRYRADYFALHRLPGLLHKLIPNQVPECFRTVRIAPVRNQTVETAQEVRIYGNADAR